MSDRTTTKRPIADQMYDVLLQQFMSGARGPGQSLNIGALSRELDVSQTPCARRSPGWSTPDSSSGKRCAATGSLP